LGLANAIRLQALSARDTDTARHHWAEALELYSSLGLVAGVEECQLHLK
jgi:hypothetical protein